MQTLAYNEVDLEELSQIIPAILNFGKDYTIWLLEGDMGAGKTTFVKVLCQYLDVEDSVSSPTFSLVNEYFSLQKNDVVYHFDCYRLNSIEEALDIGLEEYLESGKLCLVEWPSKISELLPLQFLKINISLYNSNKRNFLISQNG